MEVSCAVKAGGGVRYIGACPHMDTHPEERTCSIGAAYRRLRGKTSLRDVERLTGVPTGTLSKIERGITVDPGILTVAKLCAAIGITVDHLLVEAGIVPPSDRDRAAAEARDLVRQLAERLARL